MNIPLNLGAILQTAYSKLSVPVVGDTVDYLCSKVGPLMVVFSIAWVRKQFICGSQLFLQ